MSKNGTRRWCSMAGCGNLLNAQRHYAHRRSARTCSTVIRCEERSCRRRSSCSRKRGVAPGRSLRGRVRALPRWSPLRGGRRRRWPSSCSASSCPTQTAAARPGPRWARGSGPRWRPVATGSLRPGRGRLTGSAVAAPAAPGRQIPRRTADGAPHRPPEARWNGPLREGGPGPPTAAPIPLPAEADDSSRHL
ncbi:CGNR zinc finger domain-containing protein [Streptomyces sp. NPDC012950]|uniref:CGNR zinc finger domain-containing protein n=1 Tax=Streptomyces sp. NPDC012950 TaxID=3364858 RepID=UPI0036CE6E1C